MVVHIRSDSRADADARRRSQLMREPAIPAADGASGRRHLSSYEDREFGERRRSVLSLEELERIERIASSRVAEHDKDSQSIKTIDSQMRSLQEDVDRQTRLAVERRRIRRAMNRAANRGRATPGYG